jgi:hypothetical protein
MGLTAVIVSDTEVLTCLPIPLFTELYSDYIFGSINHGVAARNEQLVYQ